MTVKRKIISCLKGTEGNRNNKKFGDTAVNENFKPENDRRRNILMS